MSETVGEHKKGSDAMMGTFAVVAGGLAMAAAGISEAPLIYTVASAPAARSLAELPRQRQISQFGITWTFAAEVPVGQFVNGDYYVVGPATVVSIDPAPGFEDDTKSWQIQGYTWEPFVEQMWDRYRTTLEAPTDGWRRPPMSTIQH